MVRKISIGPLKIPGLTIKKGSLLTIKFPWPLDIKIYVPPWDITFWPELTLLPRITVFDPQWILDFLMEKAEWFSNAVRGVLETMIPWIAESVFNLVEPYLDKLAGDFYERHEKE